MWLEVSWAYGAKMTRDINSYAGLQRATAAHAQY